MSLSMAISNLDRPLFYSITDKTWSDVCIGRLYLENNVLNFGFWLNLKNGLLSFLRTQCSRYRLSIFLSCKLIEVDNPGFDNLLEVVGGKARGSSLAGTLEIHLMQSEAFSGKITHIYSSASWFGIKITEHMEIALK